MTRGSVAVFDSGVGGLSVLREIRRLLPEADLRYVADQAHAPYGERTLDEVRERAVAVSGHLIDRGAAVVVVACNSASAAALRHLRAVYPATPFVGMEPAVKPAALSSRRSVVGVLATEATFQGELFSSVVDRHARDVAVIARACPGLARAVEDLDLTDPELHRLLASYVEPVVARGADVLVLGCTHYSFLARQVAAIAGDGVQVIDPGPAVARRVAAVAADSGGASGSGGLDLATTGDPGAFSSQVERLLGWTEPRPRSVAI
jgi:glutamate racemase